MLRKLLLLAAIVLIFSSLLKVLSANLSIVERDLIYENLKKLKKIESDYVFAVLGDNENSISTFGNIIEKINSDPEIEFVINTGDMVFDGNPIKYDFYLKRISKLRVPLLTVPGNHDVEDHGVENYLEIFGPLYYSFHVGPAYFIVLNNSDERRIDPFQMEWLVEELEKSRAYEYRFVFMHVPIYDPHCEEQPGHSVKDLENARKLLEMLKEYDVTMVFAGHIHGYFRGDWEGVPYTITGGAGAELVGLDLKHYFYHYVKVRVSKSGVKYELVKMKSPDFNVVDRIGGFFVALHLFIHRDKRLGRNPLSGNLHPDQSDDTRRGQENPTRGVETFQIFEDLQTDILPFQKSWKNWKMISLRHSKSTNQKNFEFYRR